MSIKGMMSLAACCVLVAMIGCKSNDEAADDSATTTSASPGAMTECPAECSGSSCCEEASSCGDDCTKECCAESTASPGAMSDEAGCASEKGTCPYSGQ